MEKVEMEIKSLIENYIDENGSISQEQIDEFIWDVIGELDNSAELFDEICNNGAFGSYECSEDEESLETQIAGIIQYYYPIVEKHCDSTRQLHSSLWEIVCDDLDLDYEDETMGEIFDTIMEQYK
jgi:hypothetical protein